MSNEKLMKRIAALLQKTVENGCTQEEALAAAETAERMMREYQITQSEAELGAEGTILEEIPLYESGSMKFGKEFHIKDLISVQLGKLCTTKSWMNEQKGVLCVIGLKSDIDLFAYLIDMLSVKCWQLAVERTAHIQGERRGYRRNFILGFVSGLGRKIREVVEEREDDKTYKTSDGKSLVLVKTGIVDSRYGKETAHLNLDNGRKSYSTDKKMHLAGFSEGRKANLGRPVGGKATLQLK